MPYRSTAQRGYFHANREKLEAQGVNVAEWDSSSKGMKLPRKAKAAVRAAKKYAEGGDVNEWDTVPRSEEGRPQITVNRPITKDGREAAPYEDTSPQTSINNYVKHEFSQWFEKKPAQDVTPDMSHGKVEPVDYNPFGQGIGLANSIVGVATLPFGVPGLSTKSPAIAKGAVQAAEHLAPGLITKAAEKIAPAAPLWKAPEFFDTSKFQKVGGQKGTMPGGVFAEPASGEKFYIKEAPNLEQAKNEKLAAELYKLVGIPVADVKITQLNGKPAIASKMIEGQQLSAHHGDYAQLNGLHEGFPVDAWLANWDAPGTGPENPMGNMIVGKDGLVHRIDTGGSLYHKGTGGLKPKGAFSDDVGELLTMKDQNYSPINAAVYGNLDESAAMVGAQKLANVSDMAIAKLVTLYGPSDHLAKQNMMTTLLKRKHNVEQYYGVKPGGEIPKPVAKPRQEPIKEPNDFIDPAEGMSDSEILDHLNHEPIAEPSWMKMAKDKVTSAFTPTPQIPHTGVKDAVAGLMNTDFPISYKEKYIAKSIWDAAKKGDMAAAKEAKSVLPKALATAVNKKIWEMKNAEKPAESNKIANDLFGKIKSVQKEETIGDLLTKALKDAPSNLKSGPSSPNPKIESFVPQPHGWSNPAKYSPLDANNLVKSAHGDMGHVANELYKLSKESEGYAEAVYKKLPLMKSDLETVVKNWNDIEKIKGPANSWVKSGKESLWKQDNPKGIDYASTFLEPIKNWSGWKPPTPNFTKPFFPNKLKEMMAKAQGHNTNFEIHKGGEFYNKHPEYPEYPQEIAHPTTHKNTEPAWFGSDQAGIANKYGEYTGGTYVARGKVFEVDWPKLTGGDKNWSPQPMHNLILAAKAKNADMIIVHGMSDVGSYNQTQYAVLNPAVLRSPKANFNPQFMDKSWPLAGLVGGGLFTYGAAKEDKMNRGGVPSLLNRIRKFAGGGAPRRGEYAPWDINQGANWRIKPQPSGHIPHMGGMIKSSIPGRTDKIPLSVKSGSYIIPADIPSALGQGNTAAGAEILGKMFKIGSGGRSGGGKMPGFSWMKQPKYMKAEGGGTGEQTENQVPIIAAGGEMVVPPEVVIEIGHGNIDAGHKVLDKFVLSTRKKNIETLKKLKPPKNG